MGLKRFQLEAISLFQGMEFCYVFYNARNIFIECNHLMLFIYI